MWSLLVVQSEQRVIYRLKARPKLTWKELTRTAVCGNSRQLIINKGAPGDQM